MPHRIGSARSSDSTAGSPPGIGPLSIGMLIAVPFVFALVELLVPALIRSAYAGESLGLFNRLISGQDRHPVDWYLDAWRRVARPAGAVLGLILVTGTASRAIPGRRNPIRRLIGGEFELSAVQVVLISAWCGALAGVLEAAFFTGRHLVKHLIADRYYPDVLWMAPLSATIAFALAGAALVILAASWGVRWGLRALSVSLFLAVAWSLLQSDGIGLYPIASVVLAIGGAVALARAVEARQAAFFRLVRRTAAGFAPLLLVGAAIGVVRLDGRIGPKAPTGSGTGTNVLLIILDTVRAANTSLHGYERATTPELDEWAAQGVTFEHAVSTAPWTLPSHATMFTGRYHSELGTAPTRALGPRPTTLAEIFSRRGYRTGGFTANDAYTTRGSGLDRGFQTYRDLRMGFARFAASSWSSKWVSRFSRSLTGSPEEPWLKSAEMVREEFLTWLDREPERPFFAFLNFFDAHSPYVSPPEFMDRFGPATRRPLESRLYEPEELVGWLNAYDGAILYIDREIGRIRDALDRRGLLDNTLVIITADHGEQWGEHGLTEHGGSLYIPTLHVPLVVSLPERLPRGIRVAAGVSLRDLPATVLDLVGHADRDEIPGVSLAPLIADSTAARSLSFSEADRWAWLEDWYPAARGDMKSLVEWPLHYLRFGDGEEVLYDVASDPREEIDLFDHRVRAMPVARMRAGVDSLLRRIREGR